MLFINIDSCGELHSFGDAGYKNVCLLWNIVEL